MQMINTDRAATGGCPFSAKTFSPIFRGSLYADLAALRAVEPVAYNPETDHWVVTRHADVTAIMQDTEHFSARNASTRFTPLHENALQILRDGNFTPELGQSSMDPPRHTRIRMATNPLLNMRTAAGMEPFVRATVRSFIDRLEGKREVDLLKECLYELPAYVLFKLLGIPDQDIDHVKAIAYGRVQIDFSPSTYDQQIVGVQNLVKLWDYTVELIERRMREPQDDFPSGLVAARGGDDAVMTKNEVCTVVYGILFAGHETTTNQLTNTLQEMLRDRRSYEAITVDPALIPNAVEEGLRLCGSVVGWRRQAKTEIEVGGVTLPADAKVLLSFAAANRDPAVFEDPDRFDVHRKNARRHLTFGNGIHLCLGAPLSRLEMKVFFEEFTARYPDARLADNGAQSFFHTFVFRAPDSLMVTLR